MEYVADVDELIEFRGALLLDLALDSLQERIINANAQKRSLPQTNATTRNSAASLDCHFAAGFVAYSAKREAIY